MIPEHTPIISLFSFCDQPHPRWWQCCVVCKFPCGRYIRRGIYADMSCLLLMFLRSPSSHQLLLTSKINNLLQDACYGNQYRFIRLAHAHTMQRQHHSVYNMAATHHAHACLLTYMTSVRFVPSTCFISLCDAHCHTEVSNKLLTALIHDAAELQTLRHVATFGLGTTCQSKKEHVAWPFNQRPRTRIVPDSSQCRRTKGKDEDIHCKMCSNVQPAEKLAHPAAGHACFKGDKKVGRV